MKYLLYYIVSLHCRTRKLEKFFEKMQNYSFLFAEIAYKRRKSIESINKWNLCFLYNICYMRTNDSFTLEHLKGNSMFRLRIALAKTDRFAYKNFHIPNAVRAIKKWNKKIEKRWSKQQKEIYNIALHSYIQLKWSRMYWVINFNVFARTRSKRKNWVSINWKPQANMHTEHCTTDWVHQIILPSFMWPLYLCALCMSFSFSFLFAFRYNFPINNIRFFLHAIKLFGFWTEKFA